VAEPAPFLRTLKKPWQWLVVLMIGAILVGVALGPTGGGMPRSYARGCHSIRQTRLIYQMLVDYETEHGAFPAGRTSTEIFQALVNANNLASSGKTFEDLAGPMEQDEKVHDTAIFYVDLPGKVLATSPKLNSENVCFDLTAPMSSTPVTGLPVVFVTGYKVNYIANGAATPIDTAKIAPWSGVTYSDSSSFAMWEPSWGPSPNPVHPCPTLHPTTPSQILFLLDLIPRA
jgi:hypothetical protein